MNEIEKNSLLLHTDVLATFNDQFFEKVLTVEHITSDGAVSFPKVVSTDGEKKDINFFGWIATKGGISYLVPNTDKDGTPMKIEDVFPIVPVKWDEVGYQSKAYRLIDQGQNVSFKKENVLGMRKLVDKLSCTPHTNPKHRKLLVMAILSQVFNRSYYRFSSPPSFGKDSIVDTIGLLVGGCATIENPSVPKLEREASIRTLSGLNEVVGLTRSQWVDIGKFMLAACAYKPSITKRTRAFGNVGETINLRKFSMSLFYNDIDCYIDPKTVYFDDLAEHGIRDRLPAMRVHGRFEYDFNSINDIDIEEFVKEHWDEILEIIYTITYYQHNVYGKKYTYDLKGLPQRWQRSLGTLLRVVSEYCESQEEFNGWVAVLKGTMVDYNAMLEYPKLMKSLKEVIPDKEYTELSEKLKKEKTFINRIKVITDRLTKKEVKKEKEFKKLW
jgi:hypothetical protein